MKRFWTYIKHKRSDGNTIPPLKSVGLLDDDSVVKANILNAQFQRIFLQRARQVTIQNTMQYEWPI